MTALPPFRFSVLPGLVASLLLLGGCCANNVCDCQDEQADAIKLHFSPSFSAAQLDTIIIQRTPRPFNPANKAESVTIIRPTARVRDTIQLNNNTPFAQSGNTKLNGYRYDVQYLMQKPGSKPVATTVLVIDSISLRGGFEGNGCCTCYTNTEKTVFATKPKRTSTGADSAFVINLKQRPSIEVSK